MRIGAVLAGLWAGMLLCIAAIAPTQAAASPAPMRPRARAFTRSGRR